MSRAYTVMRYVPDTARQEFINVGVVVVSDTERRIQYRMTDDWTQAKQFGNENHLEVLQTFLPHWISTHYWIDYPEQSVSLPGITTSALRFLAREFARCRNLVQFSEPTPVAGETLEQCLDVIFRTFIKEQEE